MQRPCESFTNLTPQRVRHVHRKRSAKYFTDHFKQKLATSDFESGKKVMFDTIAGF